MAAGAGIRHLHMLCEGSRGCSVQCHWLRTGGPGSQSLLSPRAAVLGRKHQTGRKVLAVPSEDPSFLLADEQRWEVEQTSLALES